MKQNNWSSVHLKFLLLFLFGIILFQSCTIIGLAVGLNSDADKRNSFSSNPDLYDLKLGDEVTFILSNRDTISGQIVKYDTVRWMKFPLKYDGYRMIGQKKIFIPNINDTISIDSDNLFDRTFQGFSDNGIRYYHLEGEKSENLLYNQFQFLYLKSDQKVEATDLEDIFSKKAKLWRIKYIVKSNGMEYAIDSNDIAYINSDKQYYGWLIGMLIGAGIDLAFFYIIKSSMSFGGGLNFGN
jgi:hypothetical protein